MSDIASTIDSQFAENMWSTPLHEGQSYYVILEAIHRILKPKTYLEIGVYDGSSLAIAKCNSIAIDPFLQIGKEALKSKEMCLLFQMGSDEFFRSHSPIELFKSKVDVAFLDGMHWYEFLLRDFMNVERNCRNNSVIIMHDCIPTDSHVARRFVGDSRFATATENRGWWAGDVWKVVAILQKYRPELKIVAFDAPPTGLICITNINSESQVISDKYFDIVEEFRNFELDRHGDNFMTKLNILKTINMNLSEEIGRLFWI